MKTQDQIKYEYKRVSVYGKIVAGAIFLPLLCVLVFFTNTDAKFLLGIAENTWIIVYFLSMGILISMIKIYWKCPGCLRSLGSGWNQISCKKCGIEFK